MKIGFIGLGYMGHGMAKNLLQKGFDLTVKGNRNRAPVESLLGMGATEAATAAEMAGSVDVLHLCLSNSPQVEAVILGPGGVLEGARDGLIVVECSTSDPASTERLAAALAEKGAILVDAPLGRTPKEAEAGTLDAMVGATPEVFAMLKPVIEAWAANITHVGPTGAGHRMKLLMNFLAMGYGALYSEAVVLGAKAGISPQAFRQVIGSSRLTNGFFDSFMRYVVDRDRDAHKFTIANASKDVRYANQMAMDAGVMTLMASAIRNYYAHAEATRHGQDFVPMLSDLVGEMNGIDLAAVVAKG